MAKRKRKTTAARSAPRTQIIRTPAPIVRVSAPRAAAPVKRRSSLRRRASAVGGFVSQHNIDMAIAGGMVGFAVKSGLIDKLPAIPLIGRIGTAALALDYYAKHGGGDTAKRAAAGCAFLAGYQLGSKGSIDGEDGSVPGEVTSDGYE